MGSSMSLNLTGYVGSTPVMKEKNHTAWIDKNREPRVSLDIDANRLITKFTEGILLDRVPANEPETGQIPFRRSQKNEYGGGTSNRTVSESAFFILKSYSCSCVRNASAISSKSALQPSEKTLLCSTD